MVLQHPIAPSPEQVDQWFDDAVRLNSTPKYYIARQAAQWGADLELEGCCKWLPKLPPWSAEDLRKHRRPNPPSLKERALSELDALKNMGTCNSETIRRALEALPE